MGPSNLVPVGWIGCPNAGDGMVAEKFFAFKVPLNSRYDCRLETKHRWHPQSVLNHLKERDIDIGLWIDLTNTDRYFAKEEIERQEVKYLKLQVGGHGVPPSSNIVNLFIAQCKQFFADNPGKVVGVHCTHGFNRTGFLICSYLVQATNHTIREAYEEFSRARPPGIYRQNYVSFLWRIFSGSNPIPFVKDPWWTKGAITQQKDEKTNHPGRTPVKNPRKRPANEEAEPAVSKRPKTKISKKILVPQFFANIPGIHNVRDIYLRGLVLNDARKMCMESLDASEASSIQESYNRQFPGRKPHELEMKDLPLLDSKYIATRVGKGVNYLLLIKAPGQAFFIDSASSVFQATNIIFPNKRNLRKAHIINTLLDGEMLLCEHKGKTVPRFFVQDAIVINGENVSRLSYEERMSIAKQEVLDPRKHAMSKNIINQRKESPLWFEQMQFLPMTEVQRLLQIHNTNSALTTATGLKFISKNEGYKPQLLGSSFIWRKNRNMHFRIEVESASNAASLYVLQDLKAFTKVRLIPALQQCDGRIGVFSYDSLQKIWGFINEAYENIPGSYDDAISATLLKTLVTQEALMEAIQANLSFSKNKDANFAISPSN